MAVARAAGERSEGSSAAKAMMAPRERSRASRRRMTACGARVNGAGQQQEEMGGIQRDEQRAVGTMAHVEEAGGQANNTEKEIESTLKAAYTQYQSQSSINGNRAGRRHVLGTAGAQ